MTEHVKKPEFFVGVLHPMHWEEVAGGAPILQSSRVTVSELNGYQLDLTVAQILGASGQFQSVVVRLGPGYVVMGVEITDSRTDAQPRSWRPSVVNEDRALVRQVFSGWDEADPIGSLQAFVRSKVGEFAAAQRWIEPAKLSQVGNR